jgi:hypothetical protein
MKAKITTVLLISGLICMVNLSAFAQQDTTIVNRDSSYNNRDSSYNNQDTIIVKKKKFKFSMSYHNHSDSVKRKSPPAKKTGFSGAITFTRLDLGFSRLIDNGSFSLSPTNDFLDYKGIRTSTISFDVVQFGYRASPNFKVYIAGGFDWTLIRLKRNITIQGNTSELNYIDEPIVFSKNRFSNSYVHIPLNFEFRTKENDNGKRFYFVVGPEVSFLLNGKIKQISDERGKEKIKDDYHFQPFRYGGTARIGYGGIGLFTKYYVNDMFETAAQKGLKNMSFGITFGLN